MTHRTETKLLGEPGPKLRESYFSGVAPEVVISMVLQEEHRGVEQTLENLLVL